jgi:hypothetical protein
MDRTYSVSVDAKAFDGGSMFGEDWVLWLEIQGASSERT